MYYKKSERSHKKEKCTKVSQEVEFTHETLVTEGHPNLDCFAVETYGLKLDRIICESDLPDMGQNEAFVNEYEVSIDFDTKQDLQEQAEAMASERPSDTPEDWIDNFQNWEETRSDRIEYLRNQ